MNAVDTNVFIYALDDSEPEKQFKAQNLLSQLVRAPTETVLLWQVTGELLNCLRRWEVVGRVSSDDVASHFRDTLDLFSLHLPTAAVFENTFRLRSRLSHWDSMVIAACQEAGVSTLFSEDLDAGTNYDGLAVVNPFI